ncbi:hypothetical protein LZ30DRAFT_399883 [Colletotrichum cereale]|nr:hypothetical protein LZ30DRAFT_399883 [Colletotrichum cereale]
MELLKTTEEKTMMDTRANARLRCLVEICQRREGATTATWRRAQDYKWWEVASNFKAGRLARTLTCRGSMAQWNGPAEVSSATEPTIFRSPRNGTRPPGLDLVGSALATVACPVVCSAQRRRPYGVLLPPALFLAPPEHLDLILPKLSCTPSHQNILSCSDGPVSVPGGF